MGKDTGSFATCASICANTEYKTTVLTSLKVNILYDHLYYFLTLSNWGMNLLLSPHVFPSALDFFKACHVLLSPSLVQCPQYFYGHTAHHTEICLIIYLFISCLSNCVISPFKVMQTLKGYSGLLLLYFKKHHSTQNQCRTKYQSINNMTTH